MAYVSLLQLAEIPGAKEMAQVASDTAKRAIDAGLMELTLRGGDRSGFPADQVEAADAAAARITQAITEADALVDGYLAKRYALPLASPPQILVSWARAIVRYKLHTDRQSDERTDPIVRDYRDAMTQLGQVAKGTFSLGIDDPTTGAGSVGDVLFDTGRKVFGREFLP